MTWNKSLITIIGNIYIVLNQTKSTVIFSAYDDFKHDYESSSTEDSWAPFASFDCYFALWLWMLWQSGAPLRCCWN
jgi:hypothetical protein